MERYFWRIFAGLLNGYIGLTNTGVERARQRYPSLRKRPGFVIPHGNIRCAYPGVEISREQARLGLGICRSAKVVGFFGCVAPYKGVTELAETFSEFQDARAVLLVAGKSWLGPEEGRRLAAVAANDSRIVLHLDRIPDAEVATYIRAADILVLPFREILNSGSAVLALSLDRPVLVPDKGSMRELQQFAGAEWVRLYSGDLTSETLQQQLDAVAEGASVRGRCLALEDGWAGLDWKDLAQLTLDAYHYVIGAAPQFRTRVPTSGRPLV